MPEDEQLESIQIIAPGTMLLERYRVEDELGRGAQASVFLADDTQLHRKVALKVLGDHGQDEKSSLRFRQEGKILAGLNHSNIVTIYAIGNLPDRRNILVMEYVEGRSLEQVIAQDGPMALLAIVFLFSGILRALGYLHENGILHRDLKPGNILVKNDSNAGQPEAKLVDFGIAKILSGDAATAGMTQTQFVGTPNFMSPEQCQNKTLDVRSDLYSLGCIIYFAATGKTPFSGANALEVMYKQASEEVAIDSTCPTGLSRVVKKALAKDPAKRYQNADEMLTALKGCADLTGDRQPLQKADGGNNKNSAKWVPIMTVLAVVMISLAGLAISVKNRSANSSSSSSSSSIESVQQLTPKGSTGLLRLAQAQISRNELKKAIATCKRIINIDTHMEGEPRRYAVAHLSDLYGLLGDRIESMKYAKMELRETIAAGLPASNLSEAHQLLSHCYYIQGDMKGYRSELTEAINEVKGMPEGSDRQKRLSGLLEKRGRSYLDDGLVALARKDALESFDLASKNADLVKNGAAAFNAEFFIRCCIAGHQNEQALALLKQMDEFSRDAGTRREFPLRTAFLALLADDQGANAVANEFMKIAAEKMKGSKDDSQIGDFLLSKGQLFQNRGNIAEARNLWRQSLAALLRLSYADEHLLPVGNALLNDNDPESGLKAFKKAYNTEPKSQGDHALKIVAAIQLGEYYSKQKNYAEAEKYYAECRRTLLQYYSLQYNTLKEVDNCLASLYEVEGKKSEAEEVRAELDRIQKLDGTAKQP